MAEPLLREASPNFAEMLKKDPDAIADGVRAPHPGEIMKNPTLAATFRSLAKDGKKGFYTGRIAEELVKVCRDLGGHISLDDLANHLETSSENVDPISLKFRGQGLSKNGKKRRSNGDHKTAEEAHDKGIELWEHPPNGQGIVALMALGIIQELKITGEIPT